eukprot:6018393-Ditylum_brightwellii.AAC.1
MVCPEPSCKPLSRRLPSKQEKHQTTTRLQLPVLHYRNYKLEETARWHPEAKSKNYKPHTSEG